MKKVLLTLLALVLILGVLAGAGFVGYRAGYEQGTRASGNDNIAPLARPENFGRDEMPRFNFGRDFDRRFEHGIERGFAHGPFQMMQRGRGFGMFSPFRLLTNIAIWLLVIGLVYLLFTRSGWQLSRTKQPVQDVPAAVETEVKQQDPNPENE